LGVYVAGIDNGAADLLVVLLTVIDFDDALVKVGFVAARALETANAAVDFA